MYSLDDYHYDLPEALIAQSPAPKRDGSRLLHLDRDNGAVSHRYFHDIVNLLRPSDILVVNNTRVIPGRLQGRKETGGKAELLILDYGETTVRSNDDCQRVYYCLIKASKQVGAGTRILFDESLGSMTPL